MLRQLIAECMDRTGRLVTGISIILGIVAGFALAKIVHVTDQFWANAGLLMFIGASTAFAIDLFFVSPVRLWQKAERVLRHAEARPTQHIEHQINFVLPQGISETAIAAAVRAAVDFPQPASTATSSDDADVRIDPKQPSGF